MVVAVRTGDTTPGAVADITSSAVLDDATRYALRHLTGETSENYTSTMKFDSSCVYLQLGCPRIMLLRESASYEHLFCDAIHSCFDILVISLWHVD